MHRFNPNDEFPFQIMSMKIIIIFSLFLIIYSAAGAAGAAGAAAAADVC